MSIRTIGFFVFFQSFIACQLAPESAQPVVEAGIGYPSKDTSKEISLSVINCHILTGGDCEQTPGIPATLATNIVYKSVDGGQTWQDISIGLPEDLVPEDVFTGNGDVFLGTLNGMYCSNTSTTKWAAAPFLDGRITHVYAGNAGLYACSYGRGLFLNIPGTDVWNSLNQNLPNKSVRSVVETPNGAIVISTDNGIFKSSDSGKSWKQVYGKGMVLDMARLGNILIGGSYQGVLRSTDDGDHWVSVLHENILVKKAGVIGNRFVSIFGTWDPTKINPQGITNRLRTSSDGGQTWQRMEQAPLPVQGMYDMDPDLSQMRDIYDIIQVGEQLFCSFDAGIYRSSDQGKTWDLVLASLGGYTLAVSGNVIYAVKAGGC